MSLTKMIVIFAFTLAIIHISVSSPTTSTTTTMNRTTTTTMSAMKRDDERKSFGFNKNYDIWDTVSVNKEKRFQQNHFAFDEDEDENKHKRSYYQENGFYFNSNDRFNGSNGRQSKVLNILAVPNEDECISDDGLRVGICSNVYECRMQGGKAKGECSLGFGVCCVFMATCNEEIKNNITYFISPKFPSALSKDITSCSIKINPISADISQIRLDFVHFTLGQPNRRTGICDGDIMRMGGGGAHDFVLCGQNTGQHVYFDVNPKSRDGGAVEMVMNFTSSVFNSRLWEIRVTQVPFSQRAPTGCLQYFTELEGVLQTFNFAENGRHLADQNYKVCFRQNKGFCSIGYEPCNDQSFRIGPSSSAAGGAGGGGGAGADAALADPVFGDSLETVANDPVLDQDMALSEIMNDEIEGSGSDPIPAQIQPPALGGAPSFSTIRDMFFSFRSMRSLGRRRFTARQLYSSCTDRITMPCIIEDFMNIGMGDVPSCVPVHCGSSLCAPGVSPCRIESSITPFRLGIKFGPGTGKGSPEDNIGACLRYSQVQC